MGIKNLNRFLCENCSKKSINKINFKKLENKTIVIDTSIYLYKFLSENALIENMYLLISIFREYKIVPIFIFDGKPPPEKRELLIQRCVEKKEAEQKYMNFQALMNDASENKVILNDQESKLIQNEMEKLKSQMIRVTDEDIRKVKMLFDAYGVNYYHAPGEADLLCVYLVKIGKAWGCMSDDMDMFLYGCPYVIRNISIMKHSALLYDTASILKDLDMTEKKFCEIMVLSGTDYNIYSNTSLNETIKWYYEYNKYCYSTEKKGQPIYSFYVWLIKNTKYITNFDALLKTYQIFQFNNYKELENWKDIEIPQKEMDIPLLKSIMVKEGFIFME
jgi:hypothetical protein